MPQQYNQPVNNTDASQMAYPQQPPLEDLFQKKTKPSLFKNKKILFITATIFTLIGLLIGLLAPLLFSKKPKTPVVPPVVTIDIWGKSLDEEDMVPVIEEFQKENPYIKVRYEKLISSDYKNIIKTRLSTGNVSQLPDIVEIDEAWTNELGNYLLPIDDQKIYSRYETVQINNNNPNGQVYGIPFKFDSLTLAYNKQHLNEIQTDEAELNKLSWSALIEKAKALKKTEKIKVNNRDVNQITRAGIGIGSPETVTNAEKILQLLLLQEGYPLYSTKDKKFILQTRFDEIFKFYTTFSTEKDKAWGENIGNDLDAFVAGKASMVLVRSKDIDYINSKKAESFQYGTALPGRVGIIKNLSLGTSLALPLRKTHQEQSKKFLDFITDPEHSIKLFNSEANNTFVPAQRDALSQIPVGSPFSVFADIAPSAEKFATPNYDKTSQIMKDFMIDVYKQNVAQGKNGEINEFSFDSDNLEGDLNTAFKPVALPSATQKK